MQQKEDEVARIDEIVEEKKEDKTSEDVILKSAHDYPPFTIEDVSDTNKHTPKTHLINEYLERVSEKATKYALLWGSPIQMEIDGVAPMVKPTPIVPQPFVMPQMDTPKVMEAKKSYGTIFSSLTLL